MTGLLPDGGDDDLARYIRDLAKREHVSQAWQVTVTFGPFTLLCILCAVKQAAQRDGLPEYQRETLLDVVDTLMPQFKNTLGAEIIRRVAREGGAGE